MALPTPTKDSPTEEPTNTSPKNPSEKPREPPVSPPPQFPITSRTLTLQQISASDRHESLVPPRPSVEVVFTITEYSPGYLSGPTLEERIIIALAKIRLEEEKEAEKNAEKVDEGVVIGKDEVAVSSKVDGNDASRDERTMTNKDESKEH